MKRVLVVGGGLTGLSAAVFLARAGVPVVVAERRSGTSAHPRARGLNVRTMEIFREAGLEKSVRDTDSARKLLANNGMAMRSSLAGTEKAPLRRDTGRTDEVAIASPTGWCLCDQDEVEPLLLTRARELGADVRFDTEVTALAEDADGVVATFGDGSTLRADYVIAADGARSPVRESLGVGCSGPGTLGHSASIHFRADLRTALGDQRFVLCYVDNPVVRGVLAPVDNAVRWLLHVPYFPERGESFETFDDARCAALVRAAAGVPGLAVELLQVLSWESAAWVADTFRAGRVFLAGDAAHVMPPSGAFGSNTGIQDVHNLAWRLAAVLRDGAGPAVLDAYDTERRAVARATVEQAVLRSKQRPRVGRAESAVETPFVPDAVVQLGYRYGEPGWATELTGEVGTRAPHVVVDGQSTLDLSDGGFVLLATDDTWLGRGPRTVLVDDAVATAFRLAAGGAVLLRPDGFVAWRSDSGLPLPRC